MNESRGLVYGLICTCHPRNRIRYVGKTIRDPRRRMSGHRHQANKGADLPVYRWMRKHGVSNIGFKVLEMDLEWDSLNLREVYWIAELRTFVTDGGLNVTRGGDGSRGTTLTEPQRKAISERNKGRSMPPHVKEALRLASTGRQISEETRKRMVLAARNRVRTPEEIERLRALGSPLTDRQRAEIRAELQRPDRRKLKDIAVAYGVTQSAISRYARELDIEPSATRSFGASGTNNGRSRVTKEMFDSIRSRAEAGESRKSIARSLGLGATTVGRVVSGDHHWAEN